MSPKCSSVTAFTPASVVSFSTTVSVSTDATIEANELRLPVEFKNGSAKIELTYKWAQ